MVIDFPVPFTKMSGAGNDFIIIDHRTVLVPEAEQAGFAKRVCRRMFSVGADGLILIENSAVADFRWRFYNGDGSVAEMCGNGARCAARFAYTKGIAGSRMSFETLAGIIEAEICRNDTGDDETVRLKMTTPCDFRTNLSVFLAGQEKNLSFVNSGVPHAVLFMEEEESVPVQEWGRIVRFHPLFQPAGTNVNFVVFTGPQALAIRTYERGVEAETLGCGTGATAAALLAHQRWGLPWPVEVVTRSGEVLQINCEPVSGSLQLSGSAHFIASGHIEADLLNNLQRQP